jgi:hypothetical protein
MGQRAGAFVRACIVAACVAAAAAGVPVRASTDAASRREGDLIQTAISFLPAIEAEQGGAPTTSVIEVCPRVAVFQCLCCLDPAVRACGDVRV